VDQGQVAALIAEMVAEHDIEAVQRGDVVELPALDLRVTLGRVRNLQPDVVELRVGVRLPELGGPAWDESVGVAQGATSAEANALTYWMRCVLPLFVAVRMPDHPMALDVEHLECHDSAGTRTQVLHTPTVIRTWGDPPTADMVGDPPPAVAVVEQLLTMTRAATLPVWVSAVCGPARNEVRVNGFVVTEDFPDCDSKVDWGARDGTVKQWAVFRKVPN
jgi:hypothetical protein